jgi:hypothetical protein
MLQQDRGRTHFRTRGGQWRPLTLGRQAQQIRWVANRTSSAMLPVGCLSVDEGLNTDFLVL